MLQEITYKQFLEWYHFSKIEPFDEMRADMRTAQITQYMVNMFGRREHEPWRPISDFLLFHEKPPKTEAEMLQIAKLWVAVSKDLDA